MRHNLASSGALPITRLSTGIYAVQSTVCTIAGTYNLALSSVTAVNTLGTKSFLVVSGAAVRANFTSVTLSMNAGTQQSAFDVRFYDQYGNYTDNAVPTSVLYSNATTATGSVSTGTITFAGRTGIGLYDAARVVLTITGNYELTASGLLNTGNRLFVVKSGAVRTVEFADVPDTLWTAQPLPSVIVRFRDVYGNLTNDSRPITFTKTGTPSSTGTVALNPLGTGVYTTSGTVFWRSGNYTLSVSGIAAANSLGKRTFFVKPDTARALILTAITPQSLSIGDSAVHGWTLTLTGDNFTTSSVVYGKNNNVLFPTTFVDETTLTVVIPPALRQLGSMMLEVRSTAPPDTSNRVPVFVLDTSIDYKDSLDIISSIPPSLTADEQTALAILDQNPIYVNIQPIRLAAQPSEMLMTGQLGIRLPVMTLDASIALNYPKQVGERSFVVEGNVVNDTLGKETLLAIYDRRFVSMNFSANGKQYSLQPLGNNGVHVLAELTSSPPTSVCGSSISEDSGYQSPTPPPIVSCGNQRKIRVLFLATPDALGAFDMAKGTYSNTASIAVQLQTQLVRTNTALRQSLEWSDKETVTIEAANEQPIMWNPLNGYTNGRLFQTESEFLDYISYTRLTAPRLVESDASGYFATLRRKELLNANFYIRSLRETFRADIIVIVHDQGIFQAQGLYYAGLASQISGYVVKNTNSQETGEVIPSRENSFVFLRQERITDANAHLLAHELGHILGGLHAEAASTARTLGIGAQAGIVTGEQIAPPTNPALARDIMGTDGAPTVHLYSSPKLILPGAYYAYTPSAYNQFQKLLYDGIDPKNIATNNLPANIAFPNPRPFTGPDGVSDVTSTIDKYAPTVADYQQSSVDISIQGVPQSLAKGQAATITIRLSGCAANTHRAALYIISRNQTLQPVNEIFVGSERVITYQVTMPNDADYSGITGIVTLETYSDSDPQLAANYSSDAQYFNIACSNCQTMAFKALASLQATWAKNRKRAVSENENASEFRVYSIAPNPIVSGNAELRFMLPQRANVHAVLYNALGQPVKEILQERVEQGEHVSTFSIQELPSGAYTCHITAGNKIVQQTIMIVK